jgi:tight adherence protein B
MSAEGRLSAWILCLLPVGVAGLFALTSPDYLGRFFNDPAGPAMLASSGVLLLLGILWMRLIVQIRV